jgi:hypothetical protein
MGGFVYGTEVLSFTRIEELVEQNEIEYPIVSREEIQDRSKGDAITKALVVLQTTWFLLQCAVRASQHLAVTELELATAAFAVLSIIVYVLWWDKPLDVHCHIKVQRRRGAQDDATSHKRNKLDWYRCCGPTWNKIICDAVRPFMVMMNAHGVDGVFSVVRDRKDTLDRNTSIFWWLGMLVATVFGGIHCIGWSFDFPSHTERILWRLSSVAITGIPLALVGFATGTRRVALALPAIDSLLTSYFLSVRASVSVLYFLYVISRILLLVLCFTALRSLPPSAFQTVKWTTYLPHV